MKKSLLADIILFAVTLLIFSAGIRACDKVLKKEDGYINPGVERVSFLTKVPNVGTVVQHTIEVELTSGEKVQAIIPNKMKTPCVINRGDSEIKGKRVFVKLEQKDGVYTITYGWIER